MILIMVIILICAITHSCAKSACWNETDVKVAVIIALVVSIIFILPVAIWAPLAGCEEKECVKEVELLELKDQEEKGTWYVRKDYCYSHTTAGCYDVTYAYNIEDEYDLNGKAYEEETKECHENTKIYESADCKEPVLKVFEAKGKKTLFSFAVGYKKEEYILYVPEGTILEIGKEE